ncbi:MAG: hypothetical protein GOP50_06400 [Candidatus Heimdallarchaeota archaeon]|nr:hypothetical protein [Candidatus Heimdallarchaeota archaeon]
MSESLKPLLIQLVESFSYYLIDEARREIGKDVLEVQIQDIEYIKTGGRFGDVYVIDVMYTSFYDNHKTKLAIKFMESPTEAITEIKNSSFLEKKFSTRSLVQIPRYVYVNLKSPVFIAYEGVTGINYEDAYNIRDKSFWAGYVLSIIHEGKPRPAITDIYEELYRRLVLSVFGGENIEQTIMEHSKNLIEMIATSQGGSDAFGDFHQSNLMVRTSPQDEVLAIALIDPTFWMQGAFDRFEDVGTFFGRQAFLEYRVTKQLDSTIDDIKKFIQGYNVHLREVNAIPLEELYPKGYPLDFFLAIWAMMDILDKTTTQNIPLNHADITLLKELAFSLLTEHPLSKEINNFI